MGDLPNINSVVIQGGLMKISSHTIIVENYPSEGEHLLYSTRTQALVKVDEGVRGLLTLLAQNHSYEDPSRAEDMENLYRMGFIVKSEEEEQEKLKNFLNQLKYNCDKSKFVATILTTYACNLKCVYCFEEGTRTTERLDFETGKQAVQWLKERIERLGYKGVLINYYGGEPLLNTKSMDQISSEMKEWCEAKGILFETSIQTNGYLMTPQIIGHLKQFNLKRVRISIDGVGDDHDRSRPLRGGGGTFNRIIQNIKECADLVSICVSVGYSKGDISSVEKLVEYLKKEEILHKLGEFVCTPIHPTVGPKGNPEAIRGSDCMCHHDDKTLANATRKINELMQKNGLPYKDGMSTNACTLVRENSGVTIDQKGRIYRCQSLLGHPEFALGDVWHDKFNDKQREFRDLDVWKQCPTDCTYLPMCSGGCRLMSFVGGHKNFKVASCKKPYLNEMAPVFIKRDYEKMMAVKRNKEAVLVKV